MPNNCQKVQLLIHLMQICQNYLCSMFYFDHQSIQLSHPKELHFGNGFTQPNSLHHQDHHHLQDWQNIIHNLSYFR